MTPNFEEILLELSYRTSTGIVDLTNEEHLDELVIILEENRIYNSQAINDLKEKAKKTPKVKTLTKTKGGKAKTQKDLDNVLAQKFTNPDTGREVSVATALGYAEDFPKAFNIAKGKFNTAGFSDDDIDMVDVGPDDKETPAPKQNLFPKDNTKKQASPSNTIKVSDAEKRAQQTSKPSVSIPTTKAGSSFKDAFISNTKQKGDKAEIELKKKLEKAYTQIDLAAIKSSGKKGIFQLETEEDSGKYIQIKSSEVKVALENLMSGKKLTASDKKLLKLTTKIVTNPENGDVKLYFSQKIAGRHPQQGYQSIELAKKNVEMGDALRKYALDNGLTVGKSSEGAIGKKVFNPLKTAGAVNRNEPTKKTKIEKTKEGLVVNGKLRKYKTIPNEKKLVEYYIKTGKSPEEAQKDARTTINQHKAWNEKMDDIAKVSEANGGEIDFCNFGDVSNPEGRKQTITTILKGVSSGFLSELKKYEETFGTEDLSKKPENKIIFDTLANLEKINSKSDLETDEKAREAYKRGLDELIKHMANSVDFKDAVADFTEMKVGLQYLSEGKQVYFPSAENFQTADIIIMPDDRNWKQTGAQSYEEYLATNFQLLNVSVEVVGGMSVKFRGGGGSATYNKTLQSVYKNPETQQKLLDIQGTYKVTYGNQQNVDKKAVSKTETDLNDLFKYAISKGFINKEEAQRIREIGLKQAQSEIKAAGDAGNCGGPANQKLLHKAMELQHIQQHLTAVIHNADVEYTRYSNFNQKLGTKAGKISSVEDDIADGVRTPCYSSPHHNPGYSKSVDKNGCVSITPTNQNPSHIKSHKPDLIKNFKDED